MAKQPQYILAGAIASFLLLVISVITLALKTPFTLGMQLPTYISIATTGYGIEFLVKKKYPEQRKMILISTIVSGIVLAICIIGIAFALKALSEPLPPLPL